MLLVTVVAVILGAAATVTHAQTRLSNSYLSELCHAHHGGRPAARHLPPHVALSRDLGAVAAHPGAQRPPAVRRWRAARGGSGAGAGEEVRHQPGGAGVRRASAGRPRRTGQGTRPGRTDRPGVGAAGPRARLREGEGVALAGAEGLGEVKMKV